MSCAPHSALYPAYHFSEDGLTHLNLHPSGTTHLAKAFKKLWSASPRASEKARHSAEWGWIAESLDQPYHLGVPMTRCLLGNLLTDDSFEDRVFSQLISKLSTPSEFNRLLKDSTLPIAFYCRPKRGKSPYCPGVWLAGILTELRRRLQASIQLTCPNHGELLRLGEDGDPMLRALALSELVRSWKTDLSTRVWLAHRAEHDASPWVRDLAIQESTRSWGNFPETLALLTGTIMSDPNPVVRRTALRLLAASWPWNDVKSHIVASAQRDNDRLVRCTASRLLNSHLEHYPPLKSRMSHVRWGAIRAMIRCSASPLDLASLQEVIKREQAIWTRKRILDLLLRYRPQNPIAREMICYESAEDPSPNVRQHALQCALEHWRGQPEVIHLLSSRIQNESDERLRHRLVSKFGVFLVKDPLYRSALIRVTRHDSSPAIRSAALDLLAKSDPSDIQILALLRRAATEDPASDVQRSALASIQRHWPGDPTIRSLLILQAQRQSDPAIRTKAVESLLAEDLFDEQLRELLFHLIRTDPSASVRRAAIHGLITGWRSTRGVIDLLESRLELEPDASTRGYLFSSLLDLDTRSSQLEALKIRWSLDEPDMSIRSTAVEAIAQLQPSPEEASVYRRAYMRREKLRERLEYAVKCWVEGACPEDFHKTANDRSHPRKPALPFEDEVLFQELCDTPLSQGQAAQASQAIVGLLSGALRTIVHSLSHRGEKVRNWAGERFSKSSDIWGKYLLEHRGLMSYALIDDFVDYHPRCACGGPHYRFQLQLTPAWRAYANSLAASLDNIRKMFLMTGVSMPTIAAEHAQSWLDVFNSHQFNKGRGAFEADLSLELDQRTFAKTLLAIGFELPDQERNHLQASSSRGFPPEASAFSVEDNEIFYLLISGVALSKSPEATQLLERFANDEEADRRKFAQDLLKQRSASAGES